MNSNGTGNSSNGGGIYELIIALVALAVSALALVIALFQALQQYYASAKGYASCKELVIGKWTPVIFVSAPSNKTGPLGPHREKRKPHAGKRSIPTHLKHFVESRFAWFQPPEVTCHEITYMVGKTGSYQETYTWSQEMASWLVLLMAVQRMEKESRQWQEEQYFDSNHSGHRWHTRASHEPLLDMFDRTDANNLHSLTKPYATSTNCHVVEILAMLGIHWKVFNRNENRYTAQGNDFIATGASVDGLGILFSFHKAGETWFEENRIIPNNDVKELCFGYCPTIFCPRSFKMYADEPKDLGTLQLASFAAMAETLVVIGCNTKTVKYHLFPVAFEMLGMVGIVLQIKETAFRMLPNPTIHHWDRKSFSLRTLLITYKSFLDRAAKYQKQGRQGEPQNAQAMFYNNNRISTIISEAHEIEEAFRESEKRIRDYEQCGNQEQGQKTEEPRSYSQKLMTALHTTIENCDGFLKYRGETLVQSVLRVHLQEVLGILNLRDPDNGPNGDRFENTEAKEESFNPPGQSSKAPKVSKEQTAHKNRKRIFRDLQRLDSVSYSETYTVLMDMYISSLDRERRRQESCNQPNRIQCRRTSFEPPLNGDEDELDNDRVEVEDCWVGARLEEIQGINDVWCVLVFRIICWLLLHDFHKMDVQIDKDGLFGSRLPVYIA
ncbi:hypothetical protein EDB80DRAFT_754009 [Ilyonectria destructans]|nr:hypothetical protein EDB80DRAFT_754009 [Ilyonectria destructans]